MNQHETCGTCIWNKAQICTNEASHYCGAPLKSWTTCAAHSALPSSTDELIDRLTTCAAALDHLASKAPGYRDYYADRAALCRKWITDLWEDERADVACITEGLREFEGLAL